MGKSLARDDSEANSVDVAKTRILSSSQVLNLTYSENPYLATDPADPRVSSQQSRDSRDG